MKAHVEVNGRHVQGVDVKAGPEAVTRVEVVKLALEVTEDCRHLSVKGELYGWPDGVVPQRIADLLTKYGVES